MKRKKIKKSKPLCEIGFFRGIDHALLICGRDKGHTKGHLEKDIDPWMRTPGHYRKYLFVYGVSGKREQDRT